MTGIIHADVLDGLASLPAETFHVCITSPPYWRLRSYPNVAPTTWRDGQTVCLGAEADPDSFTRHLVEVFDGVRRVLRPDGTLFINLGCTYASDIIEEQEYVLRENLSPEERAYILTELAKWQLDKSHACDADDYGDSK